MAQKAILDNKALETINLDLSNYLTKDTDIYTGKIIVNPSNTLLRNSYNEGVRINQASNGWAEVMFGGVHGTTTGMDQAWVCGRRGETRGVAAAGDFSITYDGSGDTNALVLKADGTNPYWNKKRLATQGAYAVSRPTSSSGNSLTDFDISLSITTSGRPVMIMCSGNGNPASSGHWYRATLTRDNTTIFITIGQSAGASHNLPFAINYLDIVPAGTYTYKITFVNGSGTMYFNEEGNAMIPQLIAYEI